MRQMGMVVPDIDQAMQHWVDVCGIGPWFYADRLSLTTYRYEGRTYDPPDVSMALANSGDIQLELIQQRCAIPSMYLDFLATGSEGYHHWAAFPTNYEEVRDRASANGWVAVQEGESESGSFVYFVEQSDRKTAIELVAATPPRQRVFEAVRAAAVDWDGSRPVRDLASAMNPS